MFFFLTEELKNNVIEVYVLELIGDVKIITDSLIHTIIPVGGWGPRGSWD